MRKLTYEIEQKGQNKYAFMEHTDYREKVSEGNLSFLRTDRAFEECMELAHKKWRWVHKKLA